VISYQPPPDAGLDLLYEDGALVVVNKPAGLLSVPGRGEDKADCLVSRVQAVFADAMIAHRLDMDTSGLLVLARGPAMQKKLFEMFRERKVSKRYQAVVAGVLQDKEGEVDLPLIVDWPNRPRQKVAFQEGKPSLTRFRRLTVDAAADSSRVELEPVTGRTHQLRVHMAAIGHPILGDELYAGPAQERAERLLLHASHLEFRHPITDEALRFESPPPF
jgi:tRNA pseudouridine32 synthase/23S rRNA pseudouridine746 synthase